jgi:hypothetical protein
MTDKTKKNGYDDKTAKTVEKLLHKKRMIGLLWSIDDVKMRRRDLNEDQCWQALQTCERHHDPERGVTWDDFDQASYDLFGPGNPVRVERFAKALAAYEEAELVDLLVDAMHWAKANDQDFNAVLRTAQMHFDAEAAGE